MARLGIPVANAAAIADATWDEAIAGHVAAGSAGNLVERLDLLAAGGNGEFTAARADLLARLSIIAAGGAGELTAARAALLSNLDAAVSSLATAAALATVDGNVDTIVAAIDDMKPRVATSTGYALYPSSGASITVTSGTSANGYGAWVELVATTASDRWFIGIATRQAVGADDVVVDFGLGSGGSESSTGEVPVQLFDPTVGVYVPLNPPLKIQNNQRVTIRVRDESASAIAHRFIVHRILQSNIDPWDV